MKLKGARRDIQMDDVDAELLICNEFDKASYVFSPFHSYHEGYAIILEELEELKAEIFKRASERNLEELEKEASHVGAMAMRFLVDLC